LSQLFHKNVEIQKITTDYLRKKREEYQKYKKKIYDDEIIQKIVHKIRKQSQGKKKKLEFW
jgi:hypothetical protein